MVKAYILSKENGVVQIGEIIYQPVTGAVYRCNIRPWQYSDKRLHEVGIKVVTVPYGGMDGAALALQKDADTNKFRLNKKKKR